MSSDVRSIGFIAVLTSPVVDDAIEALGDALRAADSTLGINSDGTLIYSDVMANRPCADREDIYAFDIGHTGERSKDAFLRELAKAGIEVELGTVEPYSCIWYNGSDCPATLLTKEEFLSRVR